MNFVIYGPPRTKKNSSRIFYNKKTGARFVVPSAQSTDWNAKAVEQLVRLGADSLQLDIPLNLRAIVYRQKRTGDLVNYLQAICDALQKSGAVVDDKYITTLDGCRLSHDKDNPRVEIYLTVND